MDQYQNSHPEQFEVEQPLSPIKSSHVRLHVGLIMFSVVLVILLTSVAQFVVSELVFTFAPAIAENDWYMFAFSTVPIYLVGMPLAYLLLCAIPKSAPQKQKLHPLMWVGFLCLCFALSLVTNFFGQYVNTWVNDLSGIQVENELEQMTSITPLGINILFVGILAPVFEELFFRKAIIDRLRRYGDLPAILISGLIFGMIHGNLSQIFYATAVGMLLGFIYVRTGSVLYSMSIHAGFNMIGGVYTTEILRRMGENSMPAEGDTIGWVMITAYSAFVIVSLLVGTIFYLANAKSFHRSLKQGEYTFRFDKWMNILVFNPVVWIFIALIALLVLLNLLV
jgi:membrane protease YdiL (CAAX protease family)